ncbi:hypothetical protein L6R53_00805 [Myxococcota bacterium]|nr:hypothetical protein [Myxococcota bacterium]
MTPSQTIHLFSVVAAGIGGGLAPVPGSDAPLLISLQAAMIQSLAAERGCPLTTVAAMELALTLSATMAGRQAARSLLKALPGIGAVAGALTAAALTEAVGHAALAWLARTERPA